MSTTVIALAGLGLLGSLVYAAGAIVRSLEASPTPEGGFKSPAEPFATPEPQTQCSPLPKPGAKAFRDYVIGRFGGYDAGIARDCGQGGASEHKEGRAWDWGVLAYQSREKVPESVIQGWLSELLANDAELARRAGILYMIYNRRIWSAPRHAEGWRPYTGPSAHTDHVHFSLSWAGARAQTSFYRERLGVA